MKYEAKRLLEMFFQEINNMTIASDETDAKAYFSRFT